MLPAVLAVIRVNRRSAPLYETFLSPALMQSNLGHKLNKAQLCICYLCVCPMSDTQTHILHSKITSFDLI